MTTRILYEEPVFRPPAEANSLIIQATIGCSWNKCNFCEMYSEKKFRIKEIPYIKKEIETIASQGISPKKIFLADGNAFVLKTETLQSIIELTKINFGKIQRISAYASPVDINKKTLNELTELRESGLKLLYVGIESGDDRVLEIMNKPDNYESVSKAMEKCNKAGIDISAMIITGLGGKEFSKNHAINSAKLINEIQPKFLSTLTISFPYSLKYFQTKLNHPFHPLDTHELIEELTLFIKNLNISNSIFRSNHISNYIALEGILSRDKNRILEELDFYQRKL